MVAEKKPNWREDPRYASGVRVLDREAKAILKQMDAAPELWSTISDWIHEAIREKLRRDRGFL